MAGLSNSSQHIDDGQCGASGVTRSPRPSQRARPPLRKNGTSEPKEAARLSRSDEDNGNCHHCCKASRTAAASLLPPPKPAVIGIHLFSSITTPCVSVSR